MVMMPVISHKTIIMPGPPTDLPMSAATIKTPDPIMDPATISVASTTVSFFLAGGNCILCIHSLELLGGKVQYKNNPNADQSAQNLRRFVTASVSKYGLDSFT
jgi:hypothetical protein